MSDPERGRFLVMRDICGDTQHAMWMLRISEEDERAGVYDEVTKMITEIIQSCGTWRDKRYCPVCRKDTVQVMRRVCREHSLCHHDLACVARVVAGLKDGSAETLVGISEAAADGPAELVRHCRLLEHRTKTAE